MNIFQATKNFEYLKEMHRGGLPNVNEELLISEASIASPSWRLLFLRLYYDLIISAMGFEHYKIRNEYILSSFFCNISLLQALLLRRNFDLRQCRISPS